MFKNRSTIKEKKGTVTIEPECVLLLIKDKFIYLKPETVAEGLKTISAPFNPNMSQFNG